MNVRKYQQVVSQQMSKLQMMAKVQSHEQEAGDIYVFGSNSLLQLGLPGATRKLRPMKLDFAKKRRIVYLHGESTSTFALSADKRMYFWGTSPLNPNQHIYKNYAVNDLVGIASGLSVEQLEILKEERNAQIHRHKRRMKEEAAAQKYSTILPEFDRFASRMDVDETIISLLPHEIIWKHETVVWISCGLEHVCGVTIKGRVFTYGSGANGRLGLGVNRNFVIPRFLRFDGGKERLKSDRVISCFTGTDFTALLTVKGVVYTFGCGEAYQLGHGNMSDVTIPQLVKGLNGRVIIGMACGAHHAVALTALGEVYAWGANGAGQCGVAHFDDVEVPTLLQYSRDFQRTRFYNPVMKDKRDKHRRAKEKRHKRAKKIAMAKKNNLDTDPFAHQAVEELSGTESSSDSFSSDDLPRFEQKVANERESLRKKGQTMTEKREKQIEKEIKRRTKKHEDKRKKAEKLKAKIKKEQEIEDPEKRERLRRRREILNQQKAIKEETLKELKKFKLSKLRREFKRKLKTLPDTHDYINADGLIRIHIPYMSTEHIPPNVVQVQAGALFSAMLTEEGHLYMWGDNSEGQLGIGSTMHQKVPTLVRRLRHEIIVQVACGRKHVLALSSTGRLYGWGANNEGQLGLGHRQACHVPTPIYDLSHKRIASISAGLDHSIVLEGDMMRDVEDERKFLSKKEMREKLKERLQFEKNEIARKKKNGASILGYKKPRKEHLAELLEEHREAHLHRDAQDALAGNMLRKAVMVPEHEEEEEEVDEKGKKKKKKEKEKKIKHYVAMAVMTMAAAAAP